MVEIKLEVLPECKSSMFGIMSEGQWRIPRSRRLSRLLRKPLPTQRATHHRQRCLFFICCFRYFFHILPLFHDLFGIFLKKSCQNDTTKTITTRRFPGKYLNISLLFLAFHEKKSSILYMLNLDNVFILFTFSFSFATKKYRIFSSENGKRRRRQR